MIRSGSDIANDDNHLILQYTHTPSNVLIEKGQTRAIPQANKQVHRKRTPAHMHAHESPAQVGGRSPKTRPVAYYMLDVVLSARPKKKKKKEVIPPTITPMLCIT
jgi:hypothetical protein